MNQRHLRCAIASWGNMFDPGEILGLLGRAKAFLGKSRPLWGKSYFAGRTWKNLILLFGASRSLKFKRLRWKRGRSSSTPSRKSPRSMFESRVLPAASAATDATATREQMALRGRPALISTSIRAARRWALSRATRPDKKRETISELPANITGFFAGPCPLGVQLDFAVIQSSFSYFFSLNRSTSLIKLHLTCACWYFVAVFLMNHQTAKRHLSGD